MNKTPTASRPRTRPVNWFQKKFARYIWVAWILILLALILGFTAGIYGFSESERLINPDTGSVEMPDAVYSTIKLLKLGDHSNDPSPNGYVMFARFILPLCVSLVAILGFLTFLRKCYHRLRAYKFKNHTIICGLGDRGVSYLRDAVDGYVNRQRNNLDILVLEKDEKNPGVKYCYDEGIPVFIGDVTKPDILTLARPWCAKEIFSFIPDDGQNLALANALADVYKSMKVNRQNKLKCYLSVSNLALQNQFTDHEFTFRENGESIELPIDIDFCYSHEYLAERALVKGIRNLIVHSMDADKFDWNSTPEIVIIGAGYIGRKVIANISRLFHLTNEVRIHENKVVYSSPVKLTIYDKEEKAAENLYKEYPILRNDPEHQMPYSANDEIRNLHKNLSGGSDITQLPLPDLDFKPADKADVEQPQTIAQIAYDIYSNGKIQSVIIALGDDSLTISTALQLERIFDTYAAAKKKGASPQIVVYYDKYGGFDSILGNGPSNFLQIETLGKSQVSEKGTKTKISPLCNWSTISFDEDTTADKVDKVAIGVEACYNREKPVPFPSQCPGDLTPEEYERAKTSFEKRPVLQINQNRNQVLHNQIKLNLIGYSIIRKDKAVPEGFEPINDWSEIFEAIKANAVWLCRLEHQRWWAEQLLGGGHYAKTRDNSLELHPDMVPFEYIHDVSPENYGVPDVTNELSKTQMYDHHSLIDMIVSFKYAGYLPIKRKSTQ